MLFWVLLVCLTENYEYYDAQVGMISESKRLQELPCRARNLSGEIVPLNKIVPVKVRCEKKYTL